MTNNQHSHSRYFRSSELSQIHHNSTIKNNRQADTADRLDRPSIRELDDPKVRDNRFLQYGLPSIPEGCSKITPEMLPRVALGQGEIDRLVAGIPGGSANVSAIEPLAPLQERLLIQHRMASSSGQELDPHLSFVIWEVESHLLLDRLLKAWQTLVNRHDILRTVFYWEGLDKAVQLVLRQANLEVEELQLNPNYGDTLSQLRSYCETHHKFIPLNQAPLLRLLVVHDAVQGRWLLAQVKHHLVGDYIADELINAELRSLLDETAAPLAPPVPFSNLVATARQEITQQEHHEFFSRMLANVWEPTLPFGLSRNDGNGSDGLETSLNLDSKLNLRLRAQANKHGLSLAAFFHQAWALVLARCSDQRDVVFGTVLFGSLQAGPHLAKVVGPCLNTLPFRISLVDRSVIDSLHSIQANLTQLMHHEHASLALAQRCSGVPADQPLFSALLNYHYMPAITEQLPAGVKCVLYKEHSNYPLELSVDEHNDGFALRVLVKAPLDPARICNYMATALEQISDALQIFPEISVDDLTILPEQEREELLSICNTTSHDFNAELRLHRLVEDQVVRTPDATALVFEGEQLSYLELNQRANRLAQSLLSCGVGTEMLVGVFAERSFELVVALLAVLKAGAAFVPLDPSYPSERLAKMMEDAQVKLVLVQQPLSKLLPEGDWKIELLDGLAGIGDGEATDAINDLGSPDDMAYVIFTSGSTGRPKGAINSHRGVCHHLLWMRENFNIDSDDRILFKTPIGFDVSVYEFLLPLICGAQIIMARPSGHRDPDYLVSLIEEQGISILNFVPSMLTLFLEHQRVSACISLRQVWCAGEMMMASLRDHFYERLPRAKLYNMYGPTECAIGACYTLCCSDDRRTYVPIGRPMGITQIYVLDSNLDLVPIGVSGELFIGGVQVGQGYIGRPELTAERFIPDPFSAEPGARLYSSGDLARVLPDGAIECLGRADRQVKLRGQRIELGEIETLLNRHHDVLQSVVMVREDQPGQQRLVAYVVSKKGALSGELLRESLAAQLPSYMVPSSFVSLEELPLLSNGKLNQRELPLPENHLQDPVKRDPSNRCEELLLAIWRELLGMSKIGVNDNFFDLGGNSLLAARVVTRIKQWLTVDVGPADLFRYPTISQLAEFLGNPRSASSDTPLVVFNDGGSGQPLFLVHGMHGDLFGYVGLSRAIGYSRPLYGLQLPSLEGKGPYDSIEELASHYVNEMQTVQPNGPYHLLGGSAGGWVAYAIAEKLQAQGHSVGSLILLDTQANVRLSSRLRLIMLNNMLRQTVPRHLRFLWQQPAMYFPKRALSALHSLNKSLRLIAGPKWSRHSLQRYLSAANFPAPLVRCLGTSEKDYSLALVQRYVPRPLSLDVDLISPHTGDYWSLQFWSKFITGSVRYHRLLEDHDAFYDTANAAPLAELVNDLLEHWEPQEVAISQPTWSGH